MSGGNVPYYIVTHSRVGSSEKIHISKPFRSSETKKGTSIILTAAASPTRCNPALLGFLRARGRVGGDVHHTIIGAGRCAALERESICLNPLGFSEKKQQHTHKKHKTQKHKKRRLQQQQNQHEQSQSHHHDRVRCRRKELSDSARSSS